MEKHVEKLIERAAEALDSGDAMKFAQAAQNAAGALATLQSIQNAQKK